MSTYQAPARRPLGISILAILSLIAGAIGLIAGISLLGLGGLAAVTGPTGVSTAGVVGVTLGGAVVVGAVLNLLFGWGAWNLRPWAWWWGVVANLLPIAAALVGQLSGSGQSLDSTIWGVLINVVILIYLVTPGVQRAFGRG